MKHIISLFCFLFLISCASKKASVAVAPKPTEKEVTVEKIIQKYNQNQLAFSTLYIKSDASYSDKNQSQNVNAEIKIKKDEKILISIRLLGITMAKALITPNEVKYYEKLNGNYFEGDYQLLSKWLGTDLNFSMLQNILIGKSFETLNASTYQLLSSENNLILQSKNNSEIDKKFTFNPENGSIKQQEVLQKTEGRKLVVNYPRHKIYNENLLPISVLVNALQQTDSTNINLEYHHITINEDLSFPYSVPEGYKRIYIN